MGNAFFRGQRMTRKHRSEKSYRGQIMDDYTRLLNESLKDPEFRKEWDALEPEYQEMKAMIDASLESGMTQKQLSEKAGINKSCLSRIESGDINPSATTLRG